MRNHRWTVGQIRFVANAWANNLSANRIADELAEKFGVVVTKNSIISLARRHRSLMPMKSAEMFSQACSAGIRRFDQRGAA